MRVSRCREREGVLQRDLPCGGVEKVRSTHDLRDLLVRVVHHDGELIRERPVGSLHDEIAYGPFEILGERAEKDFFEGDMEAGSPKAICPRGLARRKTAAARAGIDAGESCVHTIGCRRRSREIRPRARTAIDDSLSKKIFQRRVVKRDARRLMDDFSIPRQAVSLESSQDVVRGARRDARSVEILHADEPSPARGPCEEPRADRRHEAAEVERAGRGGREAPGRDCHFERLTRERAAT